MDYEGFKEDSSVCGVIEAYLQEKISKSFGSIDEAAEEFAKAAGLKKKYARNLLGAYRTKLVTKISTHLYDNNDDDKISEPVKQLAILCELIDADERIIKLIHDVNPKFKYPPETISATSTQHRYIAQEPIKRR